MGFALGLAEFDQLGQGARDQRVRPVVGIGQFQPGVARAKPAGFGIAVQHPFQMKGVGHALNRAFLQPGARHKIGERQRDMRFVESPQDLQPAREGADVKAVLLLLHSFYPLNAISAAPLRASS